MLGFSFNGTTSQTMAVNWKSTDRSLLPEKRPIRYEIPGRDGYYELGGDTYTNRYISGIISFFGASVDYATLRTKARSVAAWLSGEGLLIFDDEPDKAYTAKVVSAIPLEQLARAGSCEVTFDCEPYAEALTDTTTTATGQALPYTATITVGGTAPTPCVITITAKSAITGDLVITRTV